MTTWYRNKRAPALDPVGTALAALGHLDAIPTMSQSLGGFNDALLGRRRTFQLDVADPIGFDDYQPFTAAVRDHVVAGSPGYLRAHNRTAPQPVNAFLPWRTGALTLRRLRLMDTFGRIITPRWTDVVTGTALPTATAGGRQVVTLPPRLVQPARLGFRWLSADLGDRQLTEAATETPICGWLLANHLDESLMVHGADGRALGIIDRNGVWGYAPGAPPVTAAAIPDGHLRRLVAYLLGKGPAFLSAFHGALDSALETIDPPAPENDVALLVGRPLAVARASIGLELRGLPAVDQGWNALRADLARGARTPDGFVDVALPVRIGDYRRLGDGLVGFWLETADGFEDTFYAPLSEPAGHLSIRTHADGEVAVERSLSTPPQELTMLLDPRGAVHATCGVLPVKSIKIPAEQYVDALRAIEVTFRAGPVLTPADRLTVPVPVEPGHAWAWLETAADGWTGNEIAAPGPETPGPHQLREGWLRLSRQE